MRASCAALAALLLTMGAGAARADGGWTLVPAGTEDGAEVPAFELGRREVTLGEYAACAAAGACAPLDFEGCDAGYPRQEGAAGKPAVCASWEQAAAYARWAGGRLPMEREWQRAMGMSMRGSAAGPPLDIAGMHDGVWEWVADAFSDAPGGAPRDPSTRVVRGGDWHSCSRGARSRIAVDAGNRVATLGFRVARTPPR